jgi:uncharacterized protein YndB with AHSA1/START domain
MTTPDVPYRIEFEIELPASPAEVWAAVATAEGLSAWMMPTELEPREGGAIAFAMGPGATSHGRVTGFEPDRRFAIEEDWAALTGHEGADVTPLATEFLVEARSGGTSVVRIVTSAFGTGADWENESWAEMETGWVPMLDNLRLYLTSFPGQEATNLWVNREVVGPTPEVAVAAVRDAFGVASVGDRVDTRGITGRLERVVDRHFLLRLESPVPGFLSCYGYRMDEGAGVILQGYLFADDAATYVAREHAAWQRWLDEVVDAPEARSA